MTTNTSRFLSQFLEASERPEGTLSYHETRGFLFAVACAPNPVKPSEWLPIIFNDLDADYADMHEAQTVIQALIELYNQANSEVLLGNVGLPDDITIITPALENVGETSALGQWSRGFFLGHDWLIELWHQYTPKELDEELGSSLMVLSFFSGRELAEAYHGEVSPTSGKSLEEFAQTLLGMFEEAMNSYALLGRSIQKALAADAMPLEPFVSEVTAGRNDPCPCGSGKKFKKCCLH